MMEVKHRFEIKNEKSGVIVPGLPILPHGIERHIVPGGGSRGIEIKIGDEIYYDKSAGFKIEIKKEEYKVIKEFDVVVVL